MQIKLISYSGLDPKQYEEHLCVSYSIEGISRACLQELARHRIQSLSVKSTRYTLKELKDEEPFTYTTCAWGISELDEVPDLERVEKYIVLSGTLKVDIASALALDRLRECVVAGISNDITKYCLPESFKTSLVSTWNARALQNFLYLRTDKSALDEIQRLALAMFEALPDDHKYLFKDSLRGKAKDMYPYDNEPIHEV